MLADTSIRFVRSGKRSVRTPSDSQ